MSRVISHEVLSGLFDVTAEEIQNVMSGDYREEDLLLAAQINSLKKAAREAEANNGHRSLSKGKHESILEGDETEQDEESGDGRPLISLPNMWSWDYIGLYSQYAAVGKYSCLLNCASLLNPFPR